MNRGTLSCDAKSDGQFIRERHSTQSIHGTVWHSRHKRSTHDARPASFMVNEFHESLPSLAEQSVIPQRLPSTAPTLAHCPTASVHCGEAFASPERRHRHHFDIYTRDCSSSPYVPPSWLYISQHSQDSRSSCAGYATQSQFLAPYATHTPTPQQ